MKTAKKYNPDLILHGNLIRAILSLAIPVVINSFLQTMYNLTDTYWLGKIGTEQLAAINLVTPMQNIITNFGSGITVAGAVLIAQYIGAGEKEDARSMANQIFACAMGFAVVCATLCFLGTPAIVNWLGADGGTAYYARVYLRVVIWDMPFLYMVNIFSAVHQAQGDTVRPMFLNLGGITLNLFLDPFFMIILNLGTAGAALATLLAKAIPAIVAFGLLCRQENDICLNRKYMRLQKEKLGMILKIGLPTAIGGSTMQLGFLLMSKNVFVYGTEAMAAYGIGNKVNGLITLPSNAIGSATATIVGQNMGMAADFLSVMAFWCFTNGVYNTTSGLFQGTGHTEVTMAIDVTRLWVFRFLTLWFCESVLHMGVRSVWYSVVISNGISALILYVLYRCGIWKKTRIKVGKEEAT